MSIASRFLNEIMFDIHLVIFLLEDSSISPKKRSAKTKSIVPAKMPRKKIVEDISDEEALNQEGKYIF